MPATGEPPLPDAPDRPRAFWPAFLFGVALVAAKASYAPLASTWSWAEPADYISLLFARWVAGAAAADVLFALAVGLVFAALLKLAAPRPRLARALHAALVGLCAAGVMYAVVSREAFAFLDAPLTTELVLMWRATRNLGSSLAAILTAPVLAAMVGAPLLYVALVLATRRLSLRARPRLRAAAGLALAVAIGAVVAAGRPMTSSEWFCHGARRIPESPHAAIIISSMRELLGLRGVKIAESFDPDDLHDFAPGPAPLTPLAARRPRNAIVIVLESTGAAYVGACGSAFATTPNLLAEARSSLVFDRYYAHVGITANSLVSIVSSVYPPIRPGWVTDFLPHLNAASLAEPLRARGYRTAFMTSGDASWAGERDFLAGRGFDDVRDYRGLPGGKAVSSWGGEDGALVDALIDWTRREPGRPFFALVWTDQTHHPYRLSEGRAPIDFQDTLRPLPRDGAAAGELSRYLTAIHEVDGHLGRLFAALREQGLADDTLVVVTGDHGEGFGAHDAWFHGYSIYEEVVRVPFILWNPRLFDGGGRSQVTGGHVDLAPTVLDILGVESPAAFEGRSLLAATGRSPRAYFFAAQGETMLGLREGDWKYLFNAGAGLEELYDLSSDPLETHDLAAGERERCLRFRRRLSAWLAFDRLNFERLSGRR